MGDTGGLRGRKRSLYMGGVNVPFIVRWPGVVPAGRVDKTSVLAGVDVMPTILAALELKSPPGYKSDGVNVLKAFRGEDFKRENPVFWEWRGPHSQEADWPTHSVRDGPHVLIHNEDLTRVELYDVISDRSQKHDIASQNPAIVASLKAKLDAWRATLPTPFAQSPSRSVSGPPKNAPAKPTVASLEAVFKRWDKNSDGTLSLDEYRDGLSKKENAEQRFKNFDKDSDGKLTADEFVKR
ncbi:MAG: sulfatase-like hydrolase/transferase [Prosthecobacter sp.]